MSILDKPSISNINMNIVSIRNLLYSSGQLFLSQMKNRNSNLNHINSKILFTLNNYYPRTYILLIRNGFLKPSISLKTYVLAYKSLNSYHPRILTKKMFLGG